MIVERLTHEQTVRALEAAAVRYRQKHGRYPTDAVLDGAYWDLGDGTDLQALEGYVLRLHWGEELGPHAVLLRHPEVDAAESWRVFSINR